MARASGRKMYLQRLNTALSPDTYQTIAAVMEKSFTINRTPIDVTSDDDSGLQTMLAEPGKRNIEMSCSGVTTDDILLALAVAGSPYVLETLRMVMPSGASISGPFFIVSFARTGATEDKVTFEASFQSAGAWTYTPAA